MRKRKEEEEQKRKENENDPDSDETEHTKVQEERKPPKITLTRIEYVLQLLGEHLELGTGFFDYR